MILSMTAYARKQSQADWGTATWEIRSVNHRYLELSPRLPEALRDLESSMREVAKNYLHRGKLEINLRFQPGLAVGTKITLNQQLAQAVTDASQHVRELINDSSSIRTMDILRWPGMVEIQETDLEPAKSAVLALFEDTLKEVVEIRQREGEALKALIEKRLDGMDSEVKKVQALMPEVIVGQREKLQQRFDDAKIELDPERLEQEMVLLAQKIDVNEEIDRLNTHITEVRRVLKKGGVVGRRLDFLMQELNREANTLGSKSINAETTKVAVELKVLIEQMREQVQNIE